MANYTQEQWNAKKIELMETCFNGFADLGLHGTGIRTLAKHCGYNTTMIGKTIEARFHKLDFFCVPLLLRVIRHRIALLIQSVRLK